MGCKNWHVFSKRLLDEEGSMLLGHMIAVGASLTVFLAVSQMLAYEYSQQRTSNLKVTASTLQNNLMSQFLGNAIWTDTKNRNAADPFNMDCIDNAAETCPDAGATAPGAAPGVQFFIIGTQDASAASYDFTQPTAGIAPDGITPCNTFDATPGAGDPSCPFRVDLFWKPDCAGAACNPFLVTISGRLVYNGAAQPLNFAAAAFDFELTRGAQ